VPDEADEQHEIEEHAAQDEERHASWLELFFDLVVVVAVLQLAHRLSATAHPGVPPARDIVEFVVLYVAVWLVWASFTTYANVAAARTRERSMLVGMAGIGVMASAIPEATEARATAFAVAYVVTRIVAMRTWQATGQFLVSWPTAQLGVGLAPWIVSFWVAQPGQLNLWIVGLALDLWITVASGRGDDVIRQFERRRQIEAERDRRRRRSGRRPTPPPALSLARLEPTHFVERLGLFVIIVLGEGVGQVIAATTDADWDGQLAVTGAACFALLIGLWWLLFRQGFGGSTPGDVRAQFLMPAHFLTVASITVVAVGLGLLAEHPGGHAPAGGRWLAGVGLAVYLAMSTVLHARHRSWPVGALVAAVPVVLASVGHLVPGWVFAGALPAVVGVQILYVDPLRPPAPGPGRHRLIR
jgi:low temperature requirement protein LtrA